MTKKEKAHRKAAAIADTLLRELAGWLMSTDYRNISELEVVSWLWQRMKAHEAADFSFPPIVAAGTNTQNIHHEPDATRLGKDNLLLVDLGVNVDGYMSDITRCFALGKVGDQERGTYRLIRRCLEMCLARCQAGVNFRDIHDEAVAYFRRYGLEGNFRQYIGHGLGQKIHDAPYVHKDHRLKVGDVITIEPGVHFPHSHGVRLEEMVLITPTGHEVLTKAPLDLLEL